MRYFKVDYIHPQKTLVWVSNVKNIEQVLLNVKTLKQHIDEKKKQAAVRPYSILGIAGRWLLVYSANGINDDDTMLYFVDFRIELGNSAVSNILSVGAIANLKTLQMKYDPVYKEEMNTYEVSYATENEKVLKANLVSCDLDAVVLQKAKSMGVLHILESAKAKDQFQITLSDEVVDEGDYKSKNVYALVHFKATAEESDGFLYIKVYDIASNLELMGDFVKVLEQLGGKFDRAFMMQRFMPEQLN